MRAVSSVYHVIRPFLIFVSIALTILFMFRLGFLLWQFERVDDLSTALLVLLNGLRIDISTLCYLLIIPALLHPLMLFLKQSKPWIPVLRLWFLLCIVSLVFFEVATPTFINEYDLRPNRLFIEYLIYPKEVFSMLITGHLVAVLSALSALLACSIVCWKVICLQVLPLSLTGRAIESNNVQGQRVSPIVAAVSFIFLFVVLFAGARGTAGHRPINPSLVYFTTDPLINSLTLNSMYSVAFAAKQFGNEIHASKVYGHLSEQRVIDLVRQETGKNVTAFQSDVLPTLSRQIPHYRGKPKNLVIILEESLGAQFVGHLGGTGITPELDKLMQTGWNFERLYATGTRSVRGIEAVITGFTPTPARSVVKLDKSQRNFFTLASLLSRHDYATQFIYGGESHFDNMKSFFLGNGFEDIVDFDDISQPTFVGSWGACDEGLFNQAHKELTALHKSDQPFFSLVFTSSNHDPFEIPQGKIPLIAGEDDRDRAIRYADYALGNFIETAKQADYWQDTLFLIVADHDARVFGAELVPVKSFHIPGLILGKDITPRQDSRLVSQIDLAPTLLSLMGIADYHPMLGHDLSNKDIPERAMMQFDKNFAYMSNDKVAILRPEKPPAYFAYDPAAKRLVLSSEDAKLGEVALAHALFGSLAYDKQWYALRPEQESADTLEATDSKTDNTDNTSAMGGILPSI
ncbi:MAG: phosphoglycerol transferase MdoB-like AlkP superfamily enzyme [Paraglaciecola sp.]|jgi:phosphoglycerol transferase MdoB-like AlkP superfamily enzyme